MSVGNYMGVGYVPNALSWGIIAMEGQHAKSPRPDINVAFFPTSSIKIMSFFSCFSLYPFSFHTRLLFSFSFFFQWAVMTAHVQRSALTAKFSVWAYLLYLFRFRKDFFFFGNVKRKGLMFQLIWVFMGPIEYHQERLTGGQPIQILFGHKRPMRKNVITCQNTIFQNNN